MINQWVMGGVAAIILMLGASTMLLANRYINARAEVAVLEGQIQILQKTARDQEHLNLEQSNIQKRYYESLFQQFAQLNENRTRVDAAGQRLALAKSKNDPKGVSDAQQEFTSAMNCLIDVSQCKSSTQKVALPDLPMVPPAGPKPAPAAPQDH